MIGTPIPTDTNTTLALKKKNQSIPSLLELAALLHIHTSIFSGLGYFNEIYTVKPADLDRLGALSLAVL